MSTSRTFTLGQEITIAKGQHSGMDATIINVDNCQKCVTLRDEDGNIVRNGQFRSFDFSWIA